MRTGFFLGLIPLAAITQSIQASDFTFADGKHHFYLDADFAVMGKAKFDEPKVVQHTKMQYAEGTSSLFYNYFVTQNNAVVAQIGVNYMHFGWNQNPRFRQSDFYYGIASLSWVSYSVEKWRWVMNAGISFDAARFDVGNSGVYYGLLWGRYQYTDTFAFHMGFFGYIGGRNGYLLPVIGMDWWWGRRWDFKLIFPLETSINYHFNRHFVTAVMLTTFGGPYRFPRRAHDGIGRYDNAIFEVYSTGIEWDFKFHNRNNFKAGVGAGYNFGGWILIKNHRNHHGRYYKFDASPYARAYFGVSF